MKKFKELTDEIEEAVIKRLDLAKLKKRSREQSIRMRRLMKNPAYKKKVELKKKRMKSTPELMVRAQKQARDMVRKKFYPKYDEMGSCLLYTSPSPRDRQKSRMPSSA